jgi:uncharacterized membrane protein (DUF106 family)
VLAAANGVLVWLGDVVLRPVLALPPLAGLLVLSVLTAAAMLPVIARTSDQPRMARTKRGIQAALFEIRLFNDDPPAVFRSLADALKLNALYLRLSLVPLVWMAVPLLFVVTHLQSVYGYSGLEANRPALVKVGLRAAGAAGTATNRIELEAPAAVRVETEAVRLPAANEVLWRIVPTLAGEFTLTVRADGEAVTKTVHVSDRPARRSPTRVSPGLVDQVLYPAEPPIAAAGPIASIAVTYSEAGIDVFGWQVHWLIVYFVLTMAAAFMLARAVGVTL